MLVSRYEGSGEYSPNSGYKLLLDQVLHAKISQSMDLPNLITMLFTKLWALHLPRLVHDGIKPNIQELVVFIKGYLIEIEALEGLRPSSFVPKQEIWVPPDTNNIKLNYDASFNTNTNIPILGVVARNENGEILAACTYPHFGVADAFIAEAQVCEQTMTFAQELGFRSIHVEGDSLTVIKKLNNTDSDRSVLGLIIQDIKGKVRGFDSVTFGFVGRSANTTAHVLARSGCRLPAPQYWIEEARSEVERATTLD
ncbi:hypothetical protein Golax_023064 [Gossypium laxum]|uniref:RNase H type-1 domain-containing protein n=1 Tax=Gossypium laxum TaxID=34288 RepID=A0A7J9B6E6_9ROSI|nr:hypothetical protein [Gossypium laxum]